MAKMSQDGGQIRQVTLNVNVGYAKSVLGILKLIEFVSQSLVLLSNASRNTYYRLNKNRTIEVFFLK